MFNVELLSDRLAKASLQRRRDREAERQRRIFNDKVRTIGVSGKQNARGELKVFPSIKVACILHSREVKNKRAMERAIVSYQHQHQQPWSQREKTDLRDAQMMLPGLVGEDPDSKNRLQKQREQLSQWLIQQQSEQAAERHQRKLEGSAMTRAEGEKQRPVATKEYNLARVSHSGNHSDCYMKVANLCGTVYISMTSNKTHKKVLS
uniref:RIB43A domain with coiled-coils 2 n=1 Tax=Lates calcarifer TaxID=8187 RepID=A0A4W6BU41_LATCA